MVHNQSKTSFWSYIFAEGTHKKTFGHICEQDNLDSTTSDLNPFKEIEDKYTVAVPILYRNQVTVMATSTSSSHKSYIHISQRKLPRKIQKIQPITNKASSQERKKAKISTR